MSSDDADGQVFHTTLNQGLIATSESLVRDLSFRRYVVASVSRVDDHRAFV